MSATPHRLAALSPARGALLIFATMLAITVTGGFVTRALLPDASGTTRALIVLVVLTVIAVAVRPWFGSWHALGVKRPWLGGRPALLVLPLVLALSPLVAGVAPQSASTWLLLVVGYALTGLMEELVWRGFAYRLLEPLGPARGVLLGAALFGLAHLGNVLYRDSVPLVLAQAWGAFCFGVAYAALRRRCGALVPLMVLHFLTDLCAAATAGPSIAFLVAQDVVLLVLGLVLIVRDSRAGKRAHAAPSDVLAPDKTGGSSRPTRAAAVTEVRRYPDVGERP
jgi:membrane protease YdiL (CAAX protease family)